jgi:hypothetical protein
MIDKTRILNREKKAMIEICRESGYPGRRSLNIVHQPELQEFEGNRTERQ